MILCEPFWNEQKSLRANFSELGIVLDVNSDLRRKVTINEKGDPKLLHDAIQAKLERPVKKRKTKSMEYEEQRRLRKLMEKYGDNYVVSRLVGENVFLFELRKCREITK